MTYKLANARENERALAWLDKYWGHHTQIDYFNVRSIDEAVSLSKKFGKEGRIIAGGTDVLGLIKNKVLSPRAFIDIKNIPGLNQIIENEEGLSIGALALISDIDKSTLIAAKYPMLQAAAKSIGSPQIRNMGTLGGNLCQDVRCWYYRRSPATGTSFNCRRKTDKGQCYAISGENQYHAIMGGCECYNVCPSDMAAALLALDARIKTVNTNGGRTFAINELYTSLGHILEKDEIITGIQIPKISPQAKQRFLKFRIRNAIDFAIASVSTVITQDKDNVSTIKLILGGVSYKPYEVINAEEILKGKKITEELVTEVGKVAVCEMTPLSKNGYKIPIIEAMVKRSILE